jgi:hypothetical protein
MGGCPAALGNLRERNRENGRADSSGGGPRGALSDKVLGLFGEGDFGVCIRYSGSGDEFQAHSSDCDALLSELG